MPRHPAPHGTPHRDLDAGRGGRGADEPVGDPQRRPVGRPGQRDAVGEHAAPALVLYRRRRPRRAHHDAVAGARRRRHGARGGTGRDVDGDRAPRRRRRRRNEAHMVAGPKERGGCGIGVEQHRGCRADQLPTAGRRARIRPRETPRERDGAGRHPWPRTRPPRHVERPVGAHEVAETGREPREGDRPVGRRVARGQLRDADAELGGERMEVLAVVDDGDLDGASRRECALRDGRAGREHPRPRRRERHHRRVDDDEHRLRRRHEIDDPGPPRRHESGVQRENRLEVVHLREQRALAEGPHPDAAADHRVAVRHHGAATSTPAASSAARTARAMATAPGESPWTQSDAAPVATRLPSTASTTPSRASRSARAATSSGSCRSAPGSLRGTSPPSGR